MENFRASGTYTKQAHVRIPEGLYEEEHARKGFFGRVSQLYHENPLTGWTDIDGELRPYQIPDVGKTPEVQNGYAALLYNNDVVLSMGHFVKPYDNYFRNADYDEILFIHKGCGKVETTYGHFAYETGDYVVMPRGTTYKVFVKEPSEILKIESASEFEEPTRGILGPNALYDQSAKVYPEAEVGSESGLSEYKVEVKRAGQISTITYPFNPLDVRGWKGSLYPWKISIYDYCPINSHKYHIPPSGHSMFVAQNFVICSFVARPLEFTSEQVLKVPFYHSNIDYEEVLFYHKGNFFSRDNIGPGAFTFHPQGIHHGPHPNAFKTANDKEFTDEYAVMVDTRYPLHRTEFFKKYENKDYWKSWFPKED